MQPLELTILIPTYNEATKLPQTLSSLSQHISNNLLGPVSVKEVIIIDDGSTDDTVLLAQKNTANFPLLKIISNKMNHGKGAVLTQGLLSAQTPWVLIADADMATPWKETKTLALTCIQKNLDMAIGSRDINGSQRLVRQSLLRENLGRLFNSLVRLITGLPFKDTQCGFKLFNKLAYSSYISLLKTKRFAWDVELLLLGKILNLKIKEVPIKWRHIKGSHVHIINDGFDMLTSLFAINIRYFFIKFQLHKKREAPQSPPLN